MKNNWENIRKEIRQQKVPLSKDAWPNMASQLDAPKRKRGWLLWSVVVFLGMGTGAGFLYLDERTRLPQIFMTEPGGKETLQGGEERHNNNPIGKELKPADEVARFPEKHQAGRNPERAEEEPSIQDRNAPRPNKAGKATSSHTSPDAGLQRTMEKLLVVEALEIRTFVQEELPESKLTGIPASAERLPESTAKRKPVPVRPELRLYASGTYNIPDYSFNTSGAGTHKEYRNVFENSVQPGMGYDLGAELRIRLFHNFRVGTGAGFRKIVTQNDFSYEISEIPVIDSASGDIIAYLPSGNPRQVRETSANSYTYFSFPLSLYYEVPLRGRWSLTGEAIHNFCFLIGSNAKAVNPTTLEMQDQVNNNLRKNINSYQLRLGLKYTLNNNLDLAIEPAYRSHYNNFFRQGSISWKPKDFSLSLSAIVKIGKSND